MTTRTTRTGHEGALHGAPDAGNESMPEVTVYDAHVRRGDNFWLVHVPGVDRTTQARTLREVAPMARDLVAVMTDLEPATIEIAVVLEVPPNAAAHWQQATDLRARAAQLQTQGAAEARAAARTLRDLGLTVRDIGAVLQVSHQRADQLLRTNTTEDPA